jgi:ubiquinone/menaquinone biosynthesis C-methylase UbiE
MSDPRDRQLARFYDLEHRDYADDLDFYVQYASALDPEKKLPVLELGCGTGRVLLALAGAGFSVMGVDLSEGMLQVCAERAEELGLGDRVRLVRADMRYLAELPGAPFNVALCALNSFAYLTSTADQLAMLDAARRLLVQHGILVLDLTAPLPHLLPPADGEVVYQGSHPDHENGATLHKFVTATAEPSTQSHHVRIFYDLEGRDGTLKRITHPLTLRWTGRYEMELLLRLAGYGLENLYGGYDLEEYTDDSERMIFVART